VEFFFPTPDGGHEDDPAKAEELWQACRKGAEGDMGADALARRVYRLAYSHNGKTMEATVGELEQYYERERVMAIIAFPHCYKICCVIRGFLKVGDTPIVGTHAVSRVEDFE
jgi:hypothetical protein